MNAIILIGGLGTRLRPLTLNKPKALMPVLNRPFLAYQLDMLKRAGVRHVMLSAGHHTRPWESAIRKTAPKAMSLFFCYEPRPLGTGGGIRHAYDELKRKGSVNRFPVLVFNGDILMELDVSKLIKFHVQKKSEGTIVLVKVDDASRYGLIKTFPDGLIRQFIEKPAFKVSRPFVNAGVYMLEPRLLEKIPPRKVVSIERDSFPDFVENHVRMYGFPMKGYWNDIGTHSTYLAAHRDLLAKEKIPRLFGRRVRLGRSVAFHGFVSCGSDVKIGDNATISNSIIMDGVAIGENVSLADVIVGSHCRIESHARLRPGTVLGEGSLVSAYSTC